jgi:hypothetical protein
MYFEGAIVRGYCPGCYCPAPGRPGLVKIQYTELKFCRFCLSCLGPLVLFLTTWSFPHDNFISVYWIFTKLDHMIPLWRGMNPIYFGVVAIIPFDNLYRRFIFFFRNLCILWFPYTKITQLVSEIVLFWWYWPKTQHHIKFLNTK